MVYAPTAKMTNRNFASGLCRQAIVASQYESGGAGASGVEFTHEGASVAVQEPLQCGEAGYGHAERYRAHPYLVRLGLALQREGKGARVGIAAPSVLDVLLR